MKSWLRVALWLAPLAMHSGDALAWGLVTHVYFAQCLVWTVVLTDPLFRRVLKRCPEWVLAGACLPDLELVGPTSGTAAFRETHSWAQAARLITAARDERERALALGYGSHLLVDTVAHGRFVPAHERAWVNVPALTHALSEWAMDSHVRPRVRVMPAQLLHRHGRYLAGYVAAHFGCGTRVSRRALTQLELAEDFLRRTCIPDAAYRLSRKFDSWTHRRFDRYVHATEGVLLQMNALLRGQPPARDPKSDQSRKERPAISAPSAAPASTSLG
jgi:hypothetical protein